MKRNIFNFIIGFLPHHCYRIIYSLMFWFTQKAEFKNWFALGFFNAAPIFLRGKQKGLNAPFALIKVLFRDGRQLLVPNVGSRIVVGTRRGLDDLGIKVKGKICIDIGAHVGSVTLELAWRGATVYTFEPDPVNYNILKMNCSLNNLSGVHNFCKAVAKEAGEKVFFIGPSSTSGALEGAATSVITRKDSTRIVVQATSMENIFRDNQISECELLKMDCEGGEYEILFNLKKDLAAKIKNILLEIHPFEKNDKYELVQWMRELGYQYREIRWGETGCVDAVFHRD